MISLVRVLPWECHNHWDTGQLCDEVSPYCTYNIYFLEHPEAVACFSTLNFSLIFYSVISHIKKIIPVSNYDRPCFL